MLLKIYIYGYLNRVQSSRRLEHETQRNIELMWLTGRLMPDFKTIANFRKDNGKAIRRVCRQFIVLCRELNLFTQALVAIDGSKFKAVNNRDKNFTSGEDEAADGGDQREHRALSEGDGHGGSGGAGGSGAEEGPAAGQDRGLEAADAAAQGDRGADERLAGQASVTDRSGCSLDEEPRGRDRGLQRAGGSGCRASPDRRRTRLSTTVVDRDQLAPMAEKAKEALGADELTVVADRGYFKSEQILECTQSGITPLVPKTMTSNSLCRRPVRQAGLYLRRRGRRVSLPGRGARDLAVHDDRARLDDPISTGRRRARAAPMQAQCTTGDYRRITRWKHEAVLEAMQERLDRQPDSMRVRRRTVEHPFGTLKLWMGATHFLTRTLARVRTEMSLHVLAYNLKRVMQILGIGEMLRVLRA